MTSEFLINWRNSFYWFQGKRILLCNRVVGWIGIVHVDVQIYINVHIDVHLLHWRIIRCLDLSGRLLLRAASWLAREEIILSLRLEGALVVRDSEWVLPTTGNVPFFLLWSFYSTVAVRTEINKVFDDRIVRELDISFRRCGEFLIVKGCSCLILFEKSLFRSWMELIASMCNSEFEFATRSRIFIQGGQFIFTWQIKSHILRRVLMSWRRPNSVLAHRCVLTSKVFSRRVLGSIVSARWLINDLQIAKIFYFWSIWS